MGIDPSRRALLRGHVSCDYSAPVRPPWSLDEALFIGGCTRCERCVHACPERILARGDGGFPEVLFARGECTLCGACREACPRPLFHHDTEGPPWRHMATIAGHCLTYQGVGCECCRDACGPRAIRFPPRLGGPARPLLDTATCDGCGACIGVCPANAIRMRPRYTTTVVA